MRRCLLPAIVLLLAGTPAWAFIAKLYSLDEVLKESSHVYVGRFESVDLKKRTAVAAVERVLKGKQEFRRIQMNIGVGPGDHVAYLMARLRKGEPFIIYYQRAGANLASCVHAGSTWFQLFGTDNRDRSTVWWRHTHIEVYMGRTFNGSTPDLIQITTDVIAGRRKGPKANPKVAKLDPRAKTPARPTVAAVPRPVADDRDGLEAIDGWTVEADWARPARLAVEADQARGKILRLRPDGGADRKLAVTLLQHVDLVQATRLSAQVENASDGPLTVAVALGSAPDWEMYETPAVVVPARAAAARVSFPLGAATFKCKASKWQHNQPLPKRTFDKVMLLVDGAPERSSVAFDRVRGTAGGFQRALDIPHPGGEVRGIAWADLNGDERLDLTLCCVGGTVLMVNDGGRLKPIAAGLLPKIGGSRAAAWADYNLDDHPDLLTANFGLFTSAGGTLRDDSALLARPRSLNPEGAGWIDYNGDGLPDALITNGESGIRLYANTGKAPAWFRDVSDKAGLGDKGLGRGNGDFIAFADYDGDGYTDFLYNLGPGVLAHNEGDGTFVLDKASGIALPDPDYKRGVAFADYDNDGDLDLFIPARGRPRLYRNNNDGTFTDALAAAGDLAKSPGDSFAAAWGDVDLDGHLDLVVCHTRGDSRLYLGGGKGTFKDVTASSGLGGLGPCYAASLADVDDDGDLDLVLNLERKAVLLINEMDRAPKHGSLAVRLQARKGVIGAAVRVEDAGGRPLGLRELAGAEGCGGQPAPIAHFGLPHGKCRVSAALTDGRLATKTLTIASKPTTLVLRDGDFK